MHKSGDLPLDSWDEVRTAYQVARSGTVSGAADVLGVHHATVIRHIDAIEGRLGVKLFQRHARGYTPTEAGADLLQVAQATDDQFSQLAGRIKGQGEGVAGDLVVTSVGAIGAMIVPIFAAYQNKYPDVRVRFLTGERLFRLEYGEAHIAIRAGTMPSEPDNVVQPFVPQQMALVASDSYIARHGMPRDEADLQNHQFVGAADSENRAPFNQWMFSVLDAEKLVFRTSDTSVMTVIDSKPEWAAALWLVTHVDLHRTTKVQTFLQFLKDHTKDWAR